MSQAGNYTEFTIGPGVAVQTITGNSGGAVSPSAGNNISIVGDGTSVNVVGTPGSNTLTISATGATVLTYTPVAATPYVVLSTDAFIGVNTSALAITINLPNAPVTGKVYIIKDVSGNAAALNITVTTVGGVVLIDAAATYVMNTAYEAINVLFNGTKYLVY